MTRHIALIGTPPKLQPGMQTCLELAGFSVSWLDRLNAWAPAAGNPKSSRAPDLIVFHAAEAVQLSGMLADSPPWLAATPKLVIGLARHDLDAATAIALGAAAHIQTPINSTELTTIIQQVLPNSH